MPEYFVAFRFSEEAFRGESVVTGVIELPDEVFLANGVEVAASRWEAMVSGRWIKASRE